VILACRNPDKATDAVRRIHVDAPDAHVEVLGLDLSSLQSVHDASDKAHADHDRIHLLVNNAGVMGTPEGRTDDNFETQLGVDHLGHWALTAHLLPALLAAPAARVVTVTSFARLMGQPVDPANPHLEGTYDPWRAYGQAKLANYHFGLGLQDAFVRAGVPASSLVAHPGMAHTDLQPTTVRLGGAGGQARFWARYASTFGMSPAHAAMPQLRAATDPHARGGEFYGPRFTTFGPAVRLPVLRRDNPDAIRTLWDVSERETGLAINP
ncbi:MAG TPA: SDR family NAD(P)-dependent oxidoreductase, partial [Propionibacteriaceae bacterium]|nr:SDR family NAD(P)-dependent oxidoreductase [Propionibacteriaceae bacterium]